MQTKGEPVLYATPPRKRSPSPFTIIVILLGTLCTIKFIHYLKTPPVILTNNQQQHLASFEPVLQQPVKKVTTTIKSQQQQKAALPIPPALNMEIPSACEGVDFHWLVNDREFWDGWESKVMFMRKDGKFTQKNVRITEDESVCVVAMTGPIPAVAAIKHVIHYAPADSITLTAESNTDGANIPITLNAHDKERNIYFAAVRFTHPGVYHLNALMEYRSWFWEQPSFHSYAPLQFSSKNLLVVDNKTNKQLQQQPVQKECDFRKAGLNTQTTLDSSVWMNGNRGRTQLDSKMTQKLQTFTLSNSNYTFVPNCKLNSERKCLVGKTIHMWGDKHLQRNLQSLLADNARSSVKDACNDGDIIDAAPSVIDVNTPIMLNETHTVVHFGNIDTEIAQSYQQWTGDVYSKARQLPAADVVVIGLGNEDLSMARQDPEQFAQSFYAFLTYMVNTIYPSQTIIVKTTQYASTKSGAFNYGRSLAFANIVKSSVSAIAANRRQPVLVWDTHAVAFKDNECRNSVYSTADALKLENLILTNLAC